MITDRQKAISNAVTTRLALTFIVGGIVIFALEYFTHFADGILQLQMFPIVLALIGVALLFSRVSRALTMLMVILITVGIIGFVLFGRTLGIPGAPDFLLQSYVEPINGAASADISLDLGARPLVINALADANALLSTQVDFGSTLDEQSSGGAQRVVSIHNSESGFSVVTDLFQTEPKSWVVALSPTVPTNLRISSNTTPMQLNLGAAHLTGLAINGNTGDVTATLPSGGDSYSAVISLNTGNTHLTLPEGASVNISLTSNTGNAQIEVAVHAAVQITASGGGAVHVPDTWKTINMSGLTGNGTWQTTNFAGAARPVIIIFQTGTGALTVTQGSP